MNKKLNWIFGALFSALLLTIGLPSLRSDVKADGAQWHARSSQSLAGIYPNPGDNGPKAGLV